MPRFVLDLVHRVVASTALLIVTPSGCVPTEASAGPIATALARKSSYRCRGGATGGNVAGFGALTSSRQAS